MYINILRPSVVSSKNKHKKKKISIFHQKYILAFETKSKTIYTTNVLCMQ